MICTPIKIRCGEEISETAFEVARFNWFTKIVLRPFGNVVKHSQYIFDIVRFDMCVLNRLCLLSIF